MPKHELTVLRWPEAHCACGWAARLEVPKEWGTVTGRDELLDRYNDHRRGGKGLMKRYPRNPDDRDE